MYIILGGTGFNEGAVLTRERESTLNTWLLDYPTQWFLVEVCCRIDAHHTLTGAQTNYDHWLPPPPVSEFNLRSSSLSVIFVVYFPLLNHEIDQRVIISHPAHPQIDDRQGPAIAMMNHTTPGR